VSNKTDFYYETPQVKIIDIMIEGVLCGSNEIIDENEGYWE
jgi:hypothetical protein